MIAASSHALRTYGHLFVGWLAVVAYVMSLPATSLGIAVAALGLVDTHQLESTSRRGNEVVVVFHHEERHSHTHDRAGHGHREAPSSETTFAGVVPDEDHVLVLPGALDSMTQSNPVVVPPPLVGEDFAAFEVAVVVVDSRAPRIAPAFCALLPRAGPLACLRTTELRI